MTWASARSDRSLEDGILGGADTQGREVPEATATHPRAVAAGVSPRVEAAGVSPMEVEEAGVSPTVVAAAGDSHMVVEAAGDSHMVVAATISGTSQISQKPT